MIKQATLTFAGLRVQHARRNFINDKDEHLIRRLFPAFEIEIHVQYIDETGELQSITKWLKFNELMNLLEDE